MKKLVMVLMLVCASLGLVACGGGGESSSGSPSGNNSYAGNYVGTVSSKATGPGGTATANDKAVLSVTENGQVLTANLSDPLVGASCSGVKPVYLSGNTFNMTDTSSCNIPDLGKCQINESASGSINGGKATMRGEGTITCAAGTVALTYSFKGTKQ